MDHSHVTGRVRMVLHRNCNSVEGRLMHWARRSGVEPIQFLRNVVEYVSKTWDHNPMHPTHLTENEQQIKLLRRRIRRAKTARQKQKLRDIIRSLQE